MKQATEVTFLRQDEPIEEYGRALYAVSRSVVRALLDQLGPTELSVVNCDRADVTMEQLGFVVRPSRDKGLRGDGFEWAVHEAIVGGEPKVLEPLSAAMGRASPKLRDEAPTSLLFGYERARYLGFLDAIVENAGERAKLLPDGSGRPFAFDNWVPVAAQGKAAEPFLPSRLQQVWKTDLFLGVEGDDGIARYLAATIKSNFEQLEDGNGLRIAVVPEHPSMKKVPRRVGGLHLAVLPDPDGFMLMFNDAYQAVGRALCKIGRQEIPDYWRTPSAKAIRVQEQLEKYAKVKVTEVENALNEAARQKLVTADHQLLSVAAPNWLHMTERALKIVAPKPRFEKLD